MSDQKPEKIQIRCEDIEQLAVLYSCDELESSTSAALEAHCETCPACAQVLWREAELRQAVVSLDQPADKLDPSGLLLAQCRSQLSEALDDHRASKSRPAWERIFSPLAWWTSLRGALIYRPALSMGVLIVAGFLAGVGGQRLHRTVAAPARPVLTVSASPRITEQQLQSAASANIAWVTPSGSRPATVQVDLMSQTPMSIMGSPDDSDVQRALTFVLTNSDRFDPAVRLNSLDILRTRTGDPDVLRVLCFAARTDRNPGVRMKALETLQGHERESVVQRALLDALKSDANSGVRVEAINLLLNAIHADEAVDPDVLAALRDRSANDSNNYVRLQSAAALRQLTSPELP